MEGITSKGDEPNEEIPSGEAGSASGNDIQSLLELQKEALGTFFSQQAEILGRLTSEPINLRLRTPLAHPPKRPRRDSELSLEPTANEPLDAELSSNNREPSEEDEDPLHDYSKGLLGRGVDISDESEDNQSAETSRYRDLLASTEEKMGSAIDTELAEVCRQIWGKAISNGKSRDELKKILLPSNCTIMKTPRLNTEIYIKLNEGRGENRDRSAQTKQKEAAKASVPILQAMVELKKAEKILRKIMKKQKENEGDKAVLSLVETISPMLQNSLKVLNHTFSEGLRKRRADICSSLGRQFKPFAVSTSTEDLLFDDDSMKEMKSELKVLRTRTSEKKFGYGGLPTQRQKNFQSSYKPLRSFQQGRGYHNNRNNDNRNHNNNNNNQSMVKPKEIIPEVEVSITKIDLHQEGWKLYSW